MLTVALLGPVELCRDGVPVRVPAGRVTDLLARLALDAGQQVRTERLIEDLWAGSALTTARNTLQSKVSQLRRALGDPARLASTPAGYTLQVELAQVDVHEMLRLAGQSATSRSAGHHAEAARLSAAALAWFRGEPFGGVAGGDWLEPYRARVEEARLQVHEDNLAARLALGAGGEVVGELEDLVAAHPAREALWELLIGALYRAGRQADALDAVARVRRYLATELGLDPGPALRALEQQVRIHDAELVTVTRVPAPGNLPGLSASLVGREQEQAQLIDLTRQHRLVTLTGPAGVGKTRLAIEAARATGPASPTAANDGGSWLARLETASTAEAVWHAVGAAFDLGESTESTVLARLSAAPLLLVLDNCEHLTAVLPDLVERMLRAAPGLSVLATSQVPLGIDGETTYVLEPLPIADAITLFTQRATRAPSDSRGQELVAEVCRSLDGLPLAIELAAARTKVLSLPEISRRLTDRFTLLGDPAGRRPARQRTLHAAIAWSYDLLFPDDQRGLWALSVFSGGAPLAAAERVLGALGVPAPSAMDVLDRLTDRSLLAVDEGAADQGDRFRLLDAVREFSMQRLRDSGQLDDARAAHLAWFEQAAAQAQAGSRGAEQSLHLALARAERANIDAALAWAGDHQPAAGVRVAAGFGWVWALLGTGPDGARRIRTALAAASDVPAVDLSNETCAEAWYLASWLESAGGDVRLAASDLEAADALATPDQRLVGQVYRAFLRTQEGQPADVLVILDGCRGDLAARSLVWALGAAWLLTAWARIALGEVSGAAAACGESLRIFTALQDDWARIHTGAMLGGLADAMGDHPGAVTHLAEAAAAAGRLGFDAARGLHLRNLGRAQQRSGDDAAAVASLAQAVQAGVATGDLRLAAQARTWLARVQRALEEPEAARVSARAAAAWFGPAGGGDGALLAEVLTAALDAEAGQPAASENLRAVREKARESGDFEAELLAVDALARLAAAAGRPDDARGLLQAGDGLLPSVGHLLADSDRIDRLRAEELLTIITR